jgi:hypothetical protein
MVSIFRPEQKKLCTEMLGKPKGKAFAQGKVAARKLAVGAIKNNLLQYQTNLAYC